MNISEQIQKYQEQLENWKLLLNPFNENFDVNNREYILKHISIINKEIIRLKKELSNNKANNNTTLLNTTNSNNSNFNTESINDEAELIAMHYGDKCCPPCTIL